MKMATLAVLIPLLSIVPAAIAQQHKQPALVTTDGDPLPTPAPAKVKGIIAPLGGVVLGQNPAAILGGKNPWGYEKQKSRIEASLRNYRSLIQESPLPRFDYYVQNAFVGSDIVGFDLTNGRITRIGLHYPTPPRDARYLELYRQTWKQQHEMDASATEGEIFDLHGTFAAAGTPIDVTIRKETINQGHTFVEMEINRIYWYLLYNTPSPEIAAALKSGKLAVGMTEEQVGMILGRQVKAKADLAADGMSRRVTYSHLVRFHPNEMREYAIFKTCTFAGDKLTKFEDVADQPEPKPAPPRRAGQ